LSTALPRGFEDLLVKACLYDGEALVGVWDEISSSGGSFKGFFDRERKGLSGLLPTLEAQLKRNHVTLDREAQDYVRAAALREELRYRIWRDICERILQEFQSEEIGSIALRGTALAELIYAHPAERHTHGIDLHIREEDRPRAVSALTKLNFCAPESRLGPGKQPLIMRHETGLELILHRQLYPPPCYEMPHDPIWRRSKSVTIAGIPTNALDPADALAYISGSAVMPPMAGNLRWPCDLWNLLKQGREMDWRVFYEHVESARLALPCYVTLGYMSSALGAAIPNTVMEWLSEEAQRASSLEREAAIMAVFPGVRSVLAALVGGDVSLREKLGLLRPILFPSPTCLSWTHGELDRLELPLHYVRRPLRYVAFRLKELLGR
jgi:hypothetical protein